MQLELGEALVLVVVPPSHLQRSHMIAVAYSIPRKCTIIEKVIGRLLDSCNPVIDLVRWGG